MARPSRLSRISVADLNAELARRQGQVVELKRRHDELTREIDGVRAELQALGSLNGAVGRRGPGRPTGRRRPRNKATLMSALGSALKGKTLSVGEAIDAVRAAGYRSSSPNFRAMVNISLIKGPFKRKGRGLYTAR